MARINIEDSIYQDARFLTLIGKLGIDAALGSLVRAFTVAQKYWVNNQSPIPPEEWKKQMLNQCLVDVGLSTLQDGGYYVSGSKEQFFWLVKSIESGKRGGDVSAEKRKKHEDNKIIDLSSSDPQATLDQPYSEVNPLPLPLPLKNLKNMGQTKVRPEDVHQGAKEEIYKAYPKRKGNTRKASGISSLTKLLLTEGNIPKIKLAVANYHAHCKSEKIIGTPLVSQFATFFGKEKLWEEWADKEIKQTQQVNANFKREY